MTKQQRILFISYHFPPSAAIGGQRIANFAIHLPSYGWMPHIVTIDDKNIEHLDLDRLRGLDELRIYKASVLPTPIKILSSIRDTFLKFSRVRQTPDIAKTASPDDKKSARTESLPRRLKRYLLSFLVLPDFQNGWIPTATVTALLKVRQLGIDWIITSCPPYSAHVIGLAVKSLTGRLWAADFRDPWMTADPKSKLPMSALSIRIERWLERKVVEKSDLVIFNVERLMDAYRERYNHVPAEKFVYIPNGITSRALETTTLAETYEKFTLTYTGSLYAGRSPEPVFQAISQLIQENQVAPHTVSIKLIGHCRSVEGVPIADLISQYGLDSSVEVWDPLPYAEALEIVRRSHIALLFAPNLPYQIPAKVYDYLGTGSRILAIAEEGGSADLVRETGSGQAFLPNDIEGIKQFIIGEMGSQKSAKSDMSYALVRFNARRITEDLVTNMDRAGKRSLS